LQSFHSQAYTVAYQAGDRSVESLASFKLGLALLYEGYPGDSLKYLEVYYYFCKVTSNEFGMGKVLEAIAMAMHEQVQKERFTVHIAS
jgi:hypothetical protein